jgi:hypothetical protein
VLFAGGDLPLSGFASLLDHHVPDLVAFSTTMPSNLVTLDPAVRMAQEAGVKGAIAGGAAVESSGHPIPGLKTSNSVQGIVETADGLLRQAGLN